MTIRKWIGVKDWATLASALKKRYPRGTAGERGDLAGQLVSADKVAFREAVGAAVALEEEGYAHHLPGEKGRWVFTTQPVSLRDLMTEFDEEYTEFVGCPEELREATLAFPDSRLGADKDVAEEILSGLEAAGYTSLAYDPERQRERMLISFPEAFRAV